MVELLPTWTLPGGRARGPFRASKNPQCRERYKDQDREADPGGRDPAVHHAHYEWAAPYCLVSGQIGTSTVVYLDSYIRVKARLVVGSMPAMDPAHHDPRVIYLIDEQG